MRYQVLHLTPFEQAEIVYGLDGQLLDADGRLILRPAEFYKTINRTHLRIWCLYRARYCLPTVELIDWLKEWIGDRTAIEIGAGNSDLGWHLGIKATDSYIQQTPSLRAYYQSLGQVPTSPTPDVERLEAMQAIRKYKPDVAIASWLTSEDQAHAQTGADYGVIEEKIVKECDYILIGNEQIHGNKKILRLPHATIKESWMASRAGHPEADVIYVWEKRDGETAQAQKSNDGQDRSRKAKGFQPRDDRSTRR